MKIAYLGPKGTFTEKAASSIFQKGELIPIQPITGVIMAVEQERVDRGVVPIENFYNGEVRATLDSLTKCQETRIIQEAAFPIIHCLGALSNHTTTEQILSKDQALEQCEDFLFQNYQNATQIATSSTAEAAEKIKRENILNAAAIASETALKKAGLEILASDICPNNKTRFVTLARYKTEPTGDDKTFLALHPKARDEPGVLAGILDIFREQRINAEYIQSRPDGQKGYWFYLELNGHEQDATMKLALTKLKASEEVKILGSYLNSHWKD